MRHGTGVHDVALEVLGLVALLRSIAAHGCRADTAAAADNSHGWYKCCQKTASLDLHTVRPR